MVRRTSLPSRPESGATLGSSRSLDRESTSPCSGRSGPGAGTSPGRRRGSRPTGGIGSARPGPRRRKESRPTQGLGEPPGASTPARSGPTRRGSTRRGTSGPSGRSRPRSSLPSSATPPGRSARRSGRAGWSSRRDRPTGRSADPEAIGWALTLWSERLVGDVPGREERPPRRGGPDPPGVARAGPTGQDLRAGQARLRHRGGLGRPKSDESIARFTPLDRVRLGYFRRHIGTADPRLIPQARLDLRAIEGDRRRAHWPGSAW